MPVENDFYTSRLRGESMDRPLPKRIRTAETSVKMLAEVGKSRNLSSHSDSRI